MKLIQTQDGSYSLYSELYNEAYHSRHGAFTESNHVFIKNGLLRSGFKKLRILEMGFGTGFNAYLTLLASIENNLTIDYISLEKHPVADDYQYNFKKDLSFKKILECPWNKRIQLTKEYSLYKIETDILSWDFAPAPFDLIYYDAFSPEKQPELWSTDIFLKIREHLNPAGSLVTYCAKGQVKRNLKSAGFNIEALPGPPGKREMTRAFI